MLAQMDKRIARLTELLTDNLELSDYRILQVETSLFLTREKLPREPALANKATGLSQ